MWTERCLRIHRKRAFSQPISEIASGSATHHFRRERLVIKNIFRAAPTFDTFTLDRKTSGVRLYPLENIHNSVGMEYPTDRWSCFTKSLEFRCIFYHSSRHCSFLQPAIKFILDARQRLM